MVCFPNCKINLGLYVTNKRSDGYHDIETAFYPVMFQDVLEIVPATTATLHLSGITVAGNQADNLVWKAYQLLQGQFPGKVPAFDIYLNKTIPMGAGLGGGSADGAFMLQLVNRYCQLGLSNEAMAALALQLGSDCPFFIYNTPQFAKGRGEKMAPLPISLSAYSIQLICPAVHVSTRDAFSAIVPKPAPVGLSQLASIPVTEWRGLVSNDFEAPVFLKHPALADIKTQLYTQGAIYASMSGSGSALYGIFKKGERAVIDSPLALEEVYVE